MKNRFIRIALCTFRGILILLILSACEAERKSGLVKRLESIFYDPSFARIPDRTFSVVDFGAVGDGEVLDTRAIQGAIDAAAEAGGGVVTFPEGVYLSGAIFLKSNVDLRVDEGVVIRAIQDEKEYPDIWTRIAGIEMYWPAALINIYEQKNVRISGKGIIDGNGKYWWDKFWGDPPRSGGMYKDYIDRGLRWAVDYDCKRVRALAVFGSEDISLKDFTVERSGFWTISMTYCNRVHVTGVVIRNNIGGFGPSSDGINTDSSSDILVENCDIDCNDDNLCIKAGRDYDGLRVNRPSENIVYRNCITRSGHGLITLGSETSGGMRNIEVYGLKAIGTNMGIRFKSAKVRGGIIENIWFHDIEMEEVNFPFHFELNWYPAYSYPEIPETIPPDSIPDHWKIMAQPVLPPERGIPEFRNLKLSNMTIKKARQAFYVNAFPEKPIWNVQWKDIRIEADEPGSISHAKDWTMENVSLALPGDDTIKLVNCVNVRLPDIIPASPPDTEQDQQILDLPALLENLVSGDQTAGIAVVNGKVRKFSSGDTLYSDTIRLYVHPGIEKEFAFFEPLGDGFYISQVDIRYDQETGRLSVSGERSHTWIFYIKTEGKPETVFGADTWQYDADNHWLLIRGTGSKLNIRIQKLIAQQSPVSLQSYNQN
ncbi:MAG: glycoside hydrolase family 28 protein [Bacteroidales bacterium]|nr:glycoside hydrolase family 28 protein [Bacteroidales bacterium]